MCSSTASNGPVYVEASGHSATALLEAIMTLFPLDAYDPSPAMVMDRVERDKKSNLQVPVWDEYRCILENATQQKVQLKPIERFQFYERAKKAFAVVATGETALYGNIIIKKGVIAPSELV